ncbi:shikimate kinase AroL [Oleidesulfovibrio sp.]|uniref:shikimate kinase AroL n=1 Tax=Oleidesulfovibrio sp. TaxID=2909707 RepID=UPI003A8971F1
MKRIFLVGARACGKTTVARILAEKLGWSVVDVDEAIQSKTGKSIADMVEQEGWEAFRDVESGALAESCGAEKAVIATGGGMVLRSVNRILMRSSGLVVYLYVPASILAERLSKELIASQRPSLTGDSPVDEVEAVLAQREPLYRDAAHHIVNATHSPENVASTIVEIARNHRP